MIGAEQAGERPRDVASEVLAFLLEEADTEKARSYERFFKDPAPVHGVPAAQLRKYARALHRRLKDRWSCKDAIDLCDDLIRKPHLEAKAVGLLVLSEFGPDYPARLMPKLKSWLAWHCGNWATVDLLAPDVLGALLDRRRELIPQVEAWTESPSLWVRRGAAVAFIRHARYGKHLGIAYRIAGRLLDDREDLIHKAVGWLLKEAGKTDMKRLECFLLQYRRRIPRTTVRHAIQRFEEKERMRLLAATRT